MSQNNGCAILLCRSWFYDNFRLLKNRRYIFPKIVGAWTEISWLRKEIRWTKVWACVGTPTPTTISPVRLEMRKSSGPGLPPPWATGNMGVTRCSFCTFTFSHPLLFMSKLCIPCNALSEITIYFIEEIKRVWNTNATGGIKVQNWILLV